MPGKLVRVVAIMALVALCAAAAAQPSQSRKREYMLVGIDDKVVFGDDGVVQMRPPGGDLVAIVDIGTHPANPRIVARLPLMNSIIGPPTNLMITPDGKLALVANSLNWVQDGDKWKGAPDDKVYVIDLTTDPPAQIATVSVGKQPSGLAINRAGNLALVANRADNSIGVLSIEGKEVRLVDTVPIGETVASVAFTPDGKRALVTKFPGNKVALLDVDGQKVTYTKRDLPVGLWPYNVGITPNGRIALTADNGNNGRSDGNVDTISVIDLAADPPRVVDHVMVDESPEGLAISPTGRVAAAILLGGSDGAKNAWFYKPSGRIAVLGINGNRVTRTGYVTVGGIPEGAVFSPDGKWLYVGNFADKTISILRVYGDRISDTGHTLALPGAPASMRGRVP